MTCEPAELERVQKSQVVRAFDIVLLGPLMVIGGRDLSRSRPLLGGLLEFFGISTIVYNARNYYRVEKALDRRRLR